MSTANGRSGESLYARLFARMYDPVMQQLEERFLRGLRGDLLRFAQGEVLEVGAGTGANFPFYGQRAQVTAIEPAQAMYRQAQERLRALSAPRIRLLNTGVGSPGLSEQLSPNSFDVIVCTLVLCTLPDLERAIVDFRQWLRPGGRLLVLEHIHDERQPQRWLQSFLAPLWKQMAEGCYLNRPTDDWLRESGFYPVSEQYYYTKWVPFYAAVLENRNEP